MANDKRLGVIPYSLKGKRVFVAGHRGMVGAAIVRRLARESCSVVTVDRRETDLMRQDQVERFFDLTKPQAVFMAAAKVGGILANSTYPADFLYDNLMIAANVTRAAHSTGVEKMLFLGSSCIYPRLAPQPILEDTLSDRTPRRNQRVVRDRQDCGHQVGTGLSAPARLRLHLGHADKPLRPRRQL